MFGWFRLQGKNWFKGPKEAFPNTGGSSSFGTLSGGQILIFPKVRATVVEVVGTQTLLDTIEMKISDNDPGSHRLNSCMPPSSPLANQD